MSDRGEDLEKELRAVVGELARREGVVLKILEQLGKIDFELEGLDSRRAVLQGNSRIVVQADAMRRALQKQRSEKQRERAEAEAEVQRARERKKLIEEELVSGAGK